MKKSLSLLLLAVTAASLYADCDSAGYACDVTGHSFYSIRPGFHSARPERVSLWRAYDAKADPEGYCGSLQLVPYFSKSTRSKELAKYFMFDGKSELQFGNFFVDGELLASIDVIATHFNLGTDGGGVSNVTFRPRSTTYAGGISWRQYFGECCESAHVWLELSSAVEHVRNDMHLEEQILLSFYPDDSNQNLSVTEAFAGKKPYYNPTIEQVTGEGWKYGKIDGKQSATHLSDIEVKLGYEFCVCDKAYLEGYIGAVFAAGNKAKGVYVFEPIVGDQSSGIMFGGAFGADLYCCNDTTVRLEIEANSRYLFRSTQVRSFDVFDKPWSRYMLVYKSFADVDAGLATEGINVFTQEFKVTPRFSNSINGALVWKNCNTELELGYNMWSRQCEKVALKNDWVDGVAFVGLTGNLQPAFPEGAGVINRAEQIGEPFIPANVPLTTQDAYAQLTIKESDLDLGSAAAPCALSNTLYAAYGYHFDGCCHPMLVGVGASYEFSGINTALSRWMVWGKLGISL